MLLNTEPEANQIQYAMLAGYLPFDDDPANPEGDNINLLYKYIVSTPLTFPEYVTPHARDLLRRILVPDPRRRADLFEVARHSWLSEYSHVVGFIGSTTKSDKDIATSALPQDGEPLLGRSASVREPSSKSPATMTGGSGKQPATSGDEASDPRNKQRDPKRRTVQLEYVAPNAVTARGEISQASPKAAPLSASSGRTRARADGQGPIEVPAREPQVLRKEVPTAAGMPPPAKPNRDQVRAASHSTALASQPTSSASRPTTGGTLGGGARLPSRGNSYSTPVAATPTTTNAQGHFSQPKPSTGYIISSPIPSDHGPDPNKLESQQNLAQYSANQIQTLAQRGHKRSSTLGSIGDRLLGRSNSRRSSKGQETASQPVSNEKRDRRYPPISMKNAIPNNTPNDMPNDDGEATPRVSTESRRRPSFSFTRKNSDAPSERRNSRRFSFLPGSFSMSNFGGSKKDLGGHESEAMDQQQIGRRDSRAPRPQSKGMAFGRGQSPSPSQSTTNSTIPLYYDADREAARAQRRSGVPTRVDPKFEKALPPQPGQMSTPPPVQRKQFRDDGYGGNRLEQLPGQPESVERYYTPTENVNEHMQQQRLDQYGQTVGRAQQQHQYAPQQTDVADDGYNSTMPLRPQQRKFDDAYEAGHGGSSSGARRVMDFFRRRGKDRSQV